MTLSSSAAPVPSSALSLFTTSGEPKPDQTIHSAKRRGNISHPFASSQPCSSARLLPPAASTAEMQLCFSPVTWLHGNRAAALCALPRRLGAPGTGPCSHVAHNVLCKVCSITEDCLRSQGSIWLHRLETEQGKLGAIDPAQPGNAKCLGSKGLAQPLPSLWRDSPAHSINAFQPSDITNEALRYWQNQSGLYWEGN